MLRSSILCSLLLLCIGCNGTVRSPHPVVNPVTIPSPVALQTEKEPKTAGDRMRDVLSLSLREADIKDVLRALARQTGHNIVVEQDVKGLVTVDLKNVSMDTALRCLLEPLGYVSRNEGSTIYVSHPRPEVQVFPLNYVALRAIKACNGQNDHGDRPGKAQGENHENVTDCDPWKALEQGIGGLLSRDGRYVVNKAASLVTVTDYPKNLKDIEGLVEAVEDTMGRQVMIEAQVVEVVLDGESRAGIDWIYAEKGWKALGTAKDDRGMPLRDSFKGTSATFKPCLRFDFGDEKQERLLAVLKTQGRVKVISNPRIAALTNQRAVIRVATEEVSFQTTTTLTEGRVPIVSTTNHFVTVGLVLNVIPHIDGTGNITMAIHPLLSERTGESIDKRTGNAIPVLAIREVDTTVRLREGETIIIGGLVRDRAGNMGTKPSELVIFLTPRIIPGKDAL